MMDNTEHGSKQPKLPNDDPNFPENLESMSAAQIAQAMEDALDHMTEETYDKAVISAYLDALDQKAPMPDMQSTDEAWAKFQKKYQDTSLVLDPPSSGRPVRTRRLLRTGLVAAIIVVCLFGVMIVAQAAGIDVFGAVARWTEETFQFSVSEEAGTEWFADYRDELSVAEVSKDLLPTWIPEGYPLKNMHVIECPDRTDIYAIFSNADRSTFDILISVYANPRDIEAHIFEKSDTQVETLQVDDKTIYLFDNLGHINAVCQYQSIVYSVTGDLSQEAIRSLFASIGDD